MTPATVIQISQATVSFDYLGSHTDLTLFHKCMHSSDAKQLMAGKP